jgi:hypothetical protein
LLYPDSISLGKTATEKTAKNYMNKAHGNGQCNQNFTQKISREGIICKTTIYMEE